MLGISTLARLLKPTARVITLDKPLLSSSTSSGDSDDNDNDGDNSKSSSKNNKGKRYFDTKMMTFKPIGYCQVRGSWGTAVAYIHALNNNSLK
jgi:hypothetical protein